MDTPIACSLTAGQYQARTANLSALARRALVTRQRTARGERLVFEDAEGIRRDLEEAIAAEASCCPFLEFELGRHDGHLLLDISGPADARPVIAELFAPEVPAA